MDATNHPEITMHLIPRSGTSARIPERGLHVLVTRLPDSADRPLPTEDGEEAFEAIDPDRDAAIREHIEPYLGRSGSTFHDTQGPLPVDVGLTEPEGGRRW